MKKYLIFDLDGTLVKSTKVGLKNALHVIKHFDKNYTEKALYIFNTTAGMNVYDQLEIIFKDKHIKDEEIRKLGEKIYKRIRHNEDKVDFFKHVTKKIKQLEKEYTLFLSTGNSTKFAKDILKYGGIYDCFELVYGSDEIKKGSQHLSIFKNYSEDEDFFEKSLYFGDGDMDKVFANEAKIDFIRIGDFEEEGNDVLDSVANVDDILKKYK